MKIKLSELKQIIKEQDLLNQPKDSKPIEVAKQSLTRAWDILSRLSPARPPGSHVSEIQFHVRNARTALDGMGLSEKNDYAENISESALRSLIRKIILESGWTPGDPLATQTLTRNIHVTPTMPGATVVSYGTDPDESEGDESEEDELLQDSDDIETDESEE